MPTITDKLQNNVNTGPTVLSLGVDNLAVLQIAGTFVGFQCALEGSDDGTNWFGLAGIRTDTFALETGTLSPTDATTRAWLVRCENLKQLRFRLIALTSGVVNVQLNSGFFAGSPLPFTVVAGIPGGSSINAHDDSDGPVTPGAVAAYSGLVGGIFNSSLPTAASGQQVALQVDANGRLITTATVSGGAGTSSNFNAAFPGAGTASGASDGTNMKPLLVDGSGFLKTVISGALPTGANTVGAVTQASGPWTINQTQWAGTAVDVNSGAKSAGTLRVVIATDQPQLTNKLLVTPDSVALPLHQSVNVDQWNANTVDTNSGTKSAGTLRVVIATDQPTNTNNLNVAVNAALPSGTNTIGNTGVVPLTSGGLTIYRNINLGTTGISVKGSAGQVYGWFIANNASYAIFVKLYNKATAPTVGTDTPVMTLQIPANSAANVNFVQGVAFGTGIGIGASKLVADADSTALTANDCVCNLLYN